MKPVDLTAISRRIFTQMVATGAWTGTLSGSSSARPDEPLRREAADPSKTLETSAHRPSVGLHEPCSAGFGRFDQPFHQKSLWNSRPLGARLGPDRVPSENEVPWLQDDAYSAARHLGTAADPEHVIRGRGHPFVWVADEGVARLVRVPHFPASVQPPSGTDGHCEIVDDETGLIHAFYRLAFIDGSWRADKYSCLPIDGTGWGCPQSPDSSRAAGISTLGGLLLGGERGMDVIPHALAISMDRNALRSGPVFPATLEDENGRTDYAGHLPLGSLLMLPEDFPADDLHSPESRAIARTLMAYGGYLVDRTVGTFGITCDHASGWNLHARAGHRGWDALHHRDLTEIRDALRRVVGVDGWADGDGQDYRPAAWRDMNLLSMRGPWTGSGHAFRFDTAAQACLFEASGVGYQVETEIRSRSELVAEPWNQWKQNCWYINPESGRSYTLAMHGHGPVSATLSFASENEQAVSVSRRLGCGDSQIIEVPDRLGRTTISLDKDAGGSASARLELIGCAP